jgi:DNA polymerase II small subunit/DNA polymerase delta subunit B
MFNVNDNKDVKDKNIEIEQKEQNVDFTGFSQNQDQVVVNKDKSIQSDKRSHVSFNDFEETTNSNESGQEKGKKQFDEYFEQGRAVQSELEKEEPQNKKQIKPKRIRRKKQREIEDFDDIKKRRAYKYKRKKYTKVEDFIAFLNDNYLDLDEIADFVLADENFHGWLKKKSKRFDESIGDFRELIEKIGN